MPAQGNAKLEVVPEQKYALGRKQIYARWDTMKDTKLNPKAFLDTIDRICPSVTKRIQGAEPWRRARRIIEQNLESERWEQELLNEARIALQHRFYGQYPISTEGKVNLYQELLDSFIDDILVKMHAIIDKDQLAEEDWFWKAGWRILAHTFANRPDIEPLLDQELDGYGTELPPEQLLAVGRCVRGSEIASKFVEIFLARLQQSSTGVNNWLRAFSELAKFRPNTFELVQNKECNRAWKYLIPIFEHELRPGDASRRRILPYSFVGLAFLLRRRAYDQSFMPPESLLARNAKEVACQAQEMARIGRLTFAREGQIDMNMELQRFIDYIDRRGHGSIAMADLD